MSGINREGGERHVSHVVFLPEEKVLITFNLLCADSPPRPALSFFSCPTKTHLKHPEPLELLDRTRLSTYCRSPVLLYLLVLKRQYCRKSTKTRTVVAATQVVLRRHEHLPLKSEKGM